jgi:hypothetical protein
MRGALLPLPPDAFMPWCSVKAQGQLLTFYPTPTLMTPNHRNNNSTPFFPLDRPPITLQRALHITFGTDISRYHTNVTELLYICNLRCVYKHKI